MATTYECPKCGRALKVPVELAGKKVKCPACQTIFITSPEETSPSPPPAPPPAEEVPVEEEPVRTKSRRGDYYEEDEEEYRPRSRRGRAKSAVAAPAIALLVLGCVYVLVNVAGLILRFINFSTVINRPPPGVDAATAAGFKFGIYAGFGIELVGLLLGGAVILGALQMKNLGNYGLAMTACILAMIPCHYCCLIGIPFGIWALITLMQEDVKSAFG